MARTPELIRFRTSALSFEPSSRIIYNITCITSEKPVHHQFPSSHPNQYTIFSLSQVALLSQRGCVILPVCLVSFNSIIPRVQYFITILQLQIYNCIQLNFVLLSSA